MNIKRRAKALRKLQIKKKLANAKNGNFELFSMSRIELNMLLKDHPQLRNIDSFSKMFAQSALFCNGLSHKEGHVNIDLEVHVCGSTYEFKRFHWPTEKLSDVVLHNGIGHYLRCFIQVLFMKRLNR